MVKIPAFLFLMVYLLSVSETVHSKEYSTTNIRLMEGVEYAVTEEQTLYLDIYLPPEFKQPPLVVFVHGGAWRAGTRTNPLILPLLNHGWAIASIDYRLSPVAPFPAQVHDIKAAIRYLRAKADEFGYKADRIAIVGVSAGGHLAALAGVTNGHPELEGNVGAFPNESSAIQVIASFYGASNLSTILSQSTPVGLKVRQPALQLLLGGLPDQQKELARLASPVSHIDSTDPALLLMHGDQDPHMPINQAHELNYHYVENGLTVQFEVIHGAGHGGEAFYNAAGIRLLDEFLKQHL